MQCAAAAMTRSALTLLVMLAAPLLPAQNFPVVHPEQWPAMKSPVGLDSQIEKEINDLLRSMTLEEKVGQVIQASITNITPTEVKAYHIGSVLNGGGGWPGDIRAARAKDWLALADAFHDASMDRSNGRKAIPVIWGSDAVHGHSNVVGATLFPHNIGLGATRNYDLARRIGEITAVEMAITGIDWDFSPVVAVARDDRWGRTYESYSEDPDVVRQMTTKMIEGLQGAPGSPEFLSHGKVVGTAKHFLGDGATEGGKDQGDAKISEAELRDIHGAGYVGALSRGVQTIMVSFSSWHGVKMNGNKALMTDVLKKRMGFDGLVVSDWNAHGQLPGCSNSSCPEALNAGIDLFMVPEDWKALYYNTLAQVKSGEVPRARLDDAVRRILRVKKRAGLFTAGKPSQRRHGRELGKFGAPAHREVARQAVRESLVLLKNNGGVLPLRPQSNLLVAGDGADNIAKQAGGWTISWQGDGNANKDFPGGTSIWEGIRKAVQAGGGKATLSESGSFSGKPDAAIVVFGENPYAEFEGDRRTIIYQDEASLRLIQRLKAAGVPVIVVFLSGRPMWVNPFLNESDAFVAVWLPGTEGDGIADVLIGNSEGKPRNDFRGKLSFSWPKSPVQVVLNRGDAKYDPLFPFGFGLTYNDRSDLPALSVDTGGIVPDRGNVYFAGDEVSPWKVEVSGPVVQEIQPGARRVLRWSGSARGEVGIRAAEPIDISREANGDLALAIEMIVRAQPTRPVILGMGSGALDITSRIRELPMGDPVSIRVRLRCFADAGANMNVIDTPFRLSTEGTMALDIAEIRLLPATEMTCPPAAK